MATNADYAYFHVSADGYLFGASTDKFAHTNRYWHLGDECEDECHIVAMVVSAECIADAVLQGTDAQVYRDGYEAWSAALADNLRLFPPFAPFD